MAKVAQKQLSEKVLAIFTTNDVFAIHNTTGITLQKPRENSVVHPSDRIAPPEGRMARMGQTSCPGPSPSFILHPSSSLILVEGDFGTPTYTVILHIYSILSIDCEESSCRRLDRPSQAKQSSLHRIVRLRRQEWKKKIRPARADCVASPLAAATCEFAIILRCARQSAQTVIRNVVFLWTTWVETERKHGVTLVRVAGRADGQILDVLVMPPDRLTDRFPARTTGTAIVTPPCRWPLSQRPDIAL